MLTSRNGDIMGKLEKRYDWIAARPGSGEFGLGGERQGKATGMKTILSVVKD